MLERTKTDILILGSGGAGLFAALHAHQANPKLDITIATKGLIGKCGCTRMVQGGYNLARKPFAGQTFDRTVHKGDLTGIEIINRLMEQVWTRPIQRLEEHRAVALIPARDGQALAGAPVSAGRT